MVYLLISMSTMEKHEVVLAKTKM